MTPSVDKRENNRYIMKIVIPLIIGMLIQAGGVVVSVVWHTRGVEARVVALEEKTIDRYFGKDAKARAQVVDYRFTRNEKDIQGLREDYKEGISKVESSVENISKKLDKYIFKQ